MKKVTRIAAIFIMLALVVSPVATISPVYASPDVETLRPNGAGTITKWDPFGATNNWECVDEVTTDNATTYVYTSANQEHDHYNLEDHTKGSGTISNVRVYARALSVVTGEEIAIEVVIGGTSYPSARQALTISFADYYENWAQNPDTTANWTWTEIDALEAGVRDYVASNEIRVTTVWVEVTYTPDWQSYESDYSTVDDLYDTGGDVIYMKGTGFAAASYKVRYYDATPTQVGTDANITVLADGILQSNLACNSDPSAADGTWNAKVYLSDGATLIADDTFTVTLAAIPEFATVISAIAVAGLCFGIYYWMRKRYRRQVAMA